jgi:peptidoglycan/LPS O-acetylase OafA/YrhL
MVAKKIKRYEELDALRGITALMVVFFHFTMGKDAYNTIFKLGTTGVDLFFIISGFVIFMSLQKITNSREFIINRVSRLYPTYWAVVIFTSVLLTVNALIKGNFDIKERLINSVGNLTMFQFYLRIPNLDGPYWTMIVEMIFYIAILFLYQYKLLKHLNMISITLCLIMVVLTHYFYDITLVKILVKGIPLLPFIPLFFAGIVFYKIYTTEAKQYANYSLVFMCFLSALALFPYAGQSCNFITYPEYCGMLILFFTLFILFVNHKLAFIVNKTTLFLGRISFALYLIHQCLSLSFIMPFLTQTLNMNFWVAVVFINLPIIIGLATFITYKIEIPYSQKLKYALRKKRRASVYNLKHEPVQVSN